MAMEASPNGFLKYAHHASASNDAYKGCRIQRYAPTVTSVVVFSKARFALSALAGSRPANHPQQPEAFYRQPDGN